MKILCLDGGGVFGFAQAQIMAGAKSDDKFDAFVGTSIGSAVSAQLALGNKIDESFFDEWMPKVFKYSFFRRVNPFIPKYADDGLNEALQDVFDGYFLGNVVKPLFVTAANLGAKKLKVFNSRDTSDAGMLMWQVIRSATAAETYFKSWNGYADGAVFANNPCMVGVAAACNVLKAKIEDIEILSIGTGDRVRPGSPNPSNLFQWGYWLVGALLNGAADSMHDYFVRSLPVKKYVRIQFAAPPEWKMDSVEAMRKAELAWKMDIEKAIQIVKEF